MVTNYKETVSGVAHLIATIFAILGLIGLMMRTRENPSQMVVMLLYGGSMIVSFGTSARLHLSQGTPEFRLRLRRHDHAAIYFVIGGTYTPLIFMLVEDSWWWVILMAIWGLCLLGMVWKLTRLYEHENVIISTTLYLSVGWFGVLCAPLWIPQLDEMTLSLILGGGAIYSIGAVIFASERPNLGRHFGFHELWHLLVMTASFLHFLAIAQLIT
jgi:hemolysin III